MFPFRAVTVAVKADAKTAHVVSVVASPDTITADGIDSSTVTSRVEDDYGFPVEGVDVRYALDTKGRPVVNIPTTRTDQSGQVTATITSTLAETLTVNVQVLVQPTNPQLLPCLPARRMKVSHY